MTIEDLKRLVDSGETRTLELKKSTGELKDGMHSACAFMNADGGVLVFGVTPVSLKLQGQQVTDATRQEIAAALTGFEPPMDIKVEYLDAPGASHGEKLIVMQFDGWVWGKHPCTYHGCAYYKPESTTKIMPQRMYDERLRASFPQESITRSISCVREKLPLSSSVLSLAGLQNPMALKAVLKVALKVALKRRAESKSKQGRKAWRSVSPKMIGYPAERSLRSWGFPSEPSSGC